MIYQPRCHIDTVYGSEQSLRPQGLFLRGSPFSCKAMDKMDRKCINYRKTAILMLDKNDPAGSLTRRRIEDYDA